MPDLCAKCGKDAEEHHAFEARPAPRGCVCDPSEWLVASIPAACRKFSPLSTYEPGLCEHCEHEEPCHGTARAADNETKGAET